MWQLFQLQPKLCVLLSFGVREFLTSKEPAESCFTGRGKGKKDSHGGGEWKRLQYCTVSRNCGYSVFQYFDRFKIVI